MTGIGRPQPKMMLDYYYLHFVSASARAAR